MVITNIAIKPKTLLSASNFRYLENIESKKTNSPIIEAEKMMAIKTRQSKYRDKIVIDLVSVKSSVNVDGIKKVNNAKATDATLGLNQEP